MKRLVFLIAILGLLSACNYRKSKVSEAGLALGTLASSQLNFANVYRKVLEPKCVRCHGSDGGVSVESYAQTVASLSRIRSAVAEDRMPQPPDTLSADQKQLLEEWIAAGAPEHSTDPSPLEPPETIPSFPAEELHFGNVYTKVLGPSCVECHGRDGGVSVETYADVIASLQKVERAVRLKTMPKPPQALAPEDRHLLLAWVAAGAPEHPSISPTTTTTTTVPPVTPSPAIEPKFASILEKVFAPKCIECHTTGKGDRVPLNTIQDLVNPQNGDDPYVVPGNWQESRLWIVTDPARNRRMPPANSGLPPLTTEERKAIEEWIKNGADD